MSSQGAAVGLGLGQRGLLVGDQTAWRGDGDDVQAHTRSELDAGDDEHGLETQ